MEVILAVHTCTVRNLMRGYAENEGFFLTGTGRVSDTAPQPRYPLIWVKGVPPGFKSIAGMRVLPW